MSPPDPDPTSSSSLPDRLRDVLFTTATPFTDGDVDHDGLAENLEHVYDAGGRTFVACGNTGEYHALTDEERVATVETHVEALSDDATVVGGAGGSTAETIDLVQAYERAGADAAMVMHPRFTHAHERGLIEHYEAVADATDLGLVLYKRGPALPDRVLRELSTVENVVAVKYAVDDIAAFGRLVAQAPGDVAWINGIAERYAPAFAVEGAGGFTTGIGNVEPEASLALRDALDDGDYDRAGELRDLLRPLEDLRAESGRDNSLAAANNVPVVKYGLDRVGLSGGRPRTPLVPLSDEDRERVDAGLEAVRDADFR